MIDFVYEEGKATQAAAYLLARAGGSMEYLKLMKLLYLADRKSFVQSGAPITGDRWVAMQRGPVLSQTLRNINDPRTPPNIWHEYIQTTPTNWSVHLKESVPLDEGELSEQDVEILESIHKKFGAWSAMRLVRYTHDLPEWTDPQGSSKRIDPRVILRAEGFPEDEIAEVERALRDIALSER